MTVWGNRTRRETSVGGKGTNSLGQAMLLYLHLGMAFLGKIVLVVLGKKLCLVG